MLQFLSENFFDSVSSLVAFVSMAIAILFGVRSARSASDSLAHEERALEHSQKSLQHSEESLEHTRETVRNERISVILAYTASVRDWGDKVMEVLSDSIILCEVDPARMPEFFNERQQLRSRLMTLIDTGRWFFPNVDHDNYGLWKEGAYQGLTQEAVTKLKEALIIVENLNYRENARNRELKKPIVEIKREICSIIQIAINPRQFSDLIGRSFK
ncbi:MAG: hypothetical protein AAGG56_00550 [Pseudomonadota bacterium]